MTEKMRTKKLKIQNKVQNGKLDCQTHSVSRCLQNSILNTVKALEIIKSTDNLYKKVNIQTFYYYPSIINNLRIYEGTLYLHLFYKF